MADDNKQPVNTNTNDDLNIDFDIILDQNEEIDNPKENSKPISQDTKQSDIDLNFDLSPEPESPKQEILTEELFPIQNNPQIIVTPEIKIEEKQVIQEIKIENTKIPEQLNINKDEISKPIENKYNPDLNSANETIQQLQEAKNQGIQTIVSDELNEMPTTQTTDAKIIQQETKIENTVPIGIINLDEMIPTSEVKTQSPIQDIPQVQFPQGVQQVTNPYDIVPQTTVKTDTGGHKKHLIMVIGIVAVCLIAGFFILKTMYPMQFGTSNGGSGNNIDNPIQETNPFQDTTPPVQEIVFTGDNLENTGVDQNINEFTGNINDLSGDIQDHNITTDSGDPFQALDNLQTTDEQKKQATIDSLKEFVKQGEYYLNLGKEKKISDMMKYGAFLTNKSTTFINQIENGEILDISSLDGYLAQSSGYLQILQNLENDTNTKPQAEESTGFTQLQTGTQTDGTSGDNTQL